jgi:hypothetical protein
MAGGLYERVQYALCRRLGQSSKQGNEDVLEQGFLIIIEQRDSLGFYSQNSRPSHSSDLPRTSSATTRTGPSS